MQYPHPPFHRWHLLLVMAIMCPLLAAPFDDTRAADGEFITGAGSGGGGGGGGGAGSTGGNGGSSNASITGTSGDDVIFGDGSGGGAGGRTTGAGPGKAGGAGGGGNDQIEGGAGDDVIVGDGFDGADASGDAFFPGVGGLGGGGGGAAGGGFGAPPPGRRGGVCGGGGGGGTIGGAVESQLVACADASKGATSGGSGGDSATDDSAHQGTGGTTDGINGGGGGGFGGAAGGNAGSPPQAGADGDSQIHRLTDTGGTVRAYFTQAVLRDVLTDFPDFGAGDDTIDGGPGSNELFGLGGSDTFIVQSGDSAVRVRIWDLSGVDTLQLKTPWTSNNCGISDATTSDLDADGSSDDSRIDFEGTSVDLINVGDVTTMTIECIETDTTPPSAPSTPDLVASSDTGVSSTDDLTQDATFTLTGTAEANATIELTSDLDGSLGSTVADGSGNWTFTPGSAVSEGVHSITATATDLADNTGPASAALSVTVDTTVPAAPSIPDLAPASDSGVSDSDDLTNDATPSLSGTTEADVSVAIESDQDGLLGTTSADGSGNWTFTPGSNLAEAAHLVTATATDVAGNTGATSTALSLTIDITPPNAPSAPALTFSASVTEDTTPTLVGTADANVAVTVTSDQDGPIGTTQSDGSGDWQLTPSIELTIGEHALTARASDSAGNSSPSSESAVLEITGHTAPIPANDSLGLWLMIAGITFLAVAHRRRLV